MVQSLNACMQHCRLWDFRIFEFSGFSEISEFLRFRNCSVIKIYKCLYVPADKLVKSPNYILYTHTHALIIESCLEQNGDTYEFLLRLAGQCNELEIWDLPLWKSQTSWNIQQDLEVFQKYAGESFFTFMVLLPNRLHSKYTCLIIQFG